MENKEYTARKIKSAFNKIDKSGKRVTVTTIGKLLGHPSPMTRNALSRSRESNGNGKNRRERKGENPFPWK